jgi:hypothetical protein
MATESAIKGDPRHPILPESWRFEVVAIRLEREPLDGGEPFLDLVLCREHERRTLRFWSPADLEIERGGPVMTSGLVILDVRSHGLSGIGVKVDDFEASHGGVRFVARTVEDVTGSAG